MCGGGVCIPISQTKQLRPGEVKDFAQGHIVCGKHSGHSFSRILTRGHFRAYRLLKRVPQRPCLQRSEILEGKNIDHFPLFINKTNDEVTGKKVLNFR